MFFPLAFRLASPVRGWPRWGENDARARRSYADWTRARPRLEVLEDRCLLTPTITEYPIPTANAYPYGITAGPDGNLWFVETPTNKIGEINPTTHAFTEFLLPTANSKDPVAITAGPDGNLWFVERIADRIGMINPTTHASADFPIPTAGALPERITAGPDGNLWFNEVDGNQIGTINPTTHAFAEFPVPTNASPFGITAGPDGNLWFTATDYNTTTQTDSGYIGEINPATHAVTEFPVPTANVFTYDITAGPDGNLWFTEGEKIGEINPATHAITEFPVPTALARLTGITAGPDGNLWFNEGGAGKIGMINPTTHAFTEYLIPYASAGPGEITAGPDGNLWFTDSGNNSIGVVTLNTTHFVVTQQPPASVTAGIPLGLTAEAEDSSGNLVSSFNGTVTVGLGENPGGDGLGGTLTVTASNGVATFSGLTLTRAASGYTIQISSDDLAAATTSVITVTPAAGSQIVIAQQPTASITAGSSFGLRAMIEDRYSNVVTADSGDVAVALASNPTGAVLGGTTSVPASQGVASFSGLMLTRAASGYTLQATGGDLPAVAIGSITVAPAAPSQLVVTIPPPNTVIAGVGFGLTVSVEDAYGNPTPSFGGQVTMTGSGTSGDGTPAGRTTLTASGGVAGFSGLVIDRAGTYMLQVSSSGLSPAAVGNLTVAPAAASRLIVTTEPPSGVTAGAGFGFQVEAEDPFGNLATGFHGSLTAALTPDAGNATLGGSTIAMAGQGVASFAGLVVDRAGSGYTVQVSGDGMTGATTAAFDVSPAAAARLVIASQPPGQVTAGVPFGLSVAAVDPYGNAVSSFTDGVMIALGNNPGGASLHGATSAAASNGLATISGLALNTVASGYTLTATTSNLTAATTAPIAVAPAAAAKLAVTIPPPIRMTAGAGFGLAIAAQDAYGNLATGFHGALTLVLASSPTGARLVGPVSMSATSGVANFPPSLILGTAGSGYTIQASGAGVAPITTGAIMVVPGAATHLVVVAQPPSSPASGGFGLVVAAEDSYGNIDPHFSGPVVIAPPNGSGAVLAGPATITAIQGVASFQGLTLSSGASTPVSLQVTGAGLTGTTTTPVDPSVPKAGSPGSGGGPASPFPTGTGGGPTATPAAPLVMTDVRVVKNKRHRVTEILIGFSGALDPAEATSAAEYQLIAAGRRGSFTARNAKSIGLRYAGYDTAKSTVALIPRKPFTLKKPVGLAVDFLRGPLFVIRRGAAR